MNASESEATRMPETEPDNVLFRVQRGLCGYIRYLAACEMNESFSEYVLYEPALRILTARGFRVKCEVICPGIPYAGRGDYKKIDFEVEGPRNRFAIEMKWVEAAKVDVSNDLEKLAAYRQAHADARSFLCVFGKNSDVAEIDLSAPELEPFGLYVVADLMKTRYACRVYELRASQD